MNRLTGYILAALSVLLCSCTRETFMAGNCDNLQPICFGGESAGLTKSVRTGSLAAKDLGYSYTVTGYTVSDDRFTQVFDHYRVNYASGSEGTSRTNPVGWEYVGQTPSPLSNALSQEIKYWDTGAKYIFVAFSKGEGNASFTRIVNTTINNGNNSPTAENSAFRIDGKITDIEGAYYADLQVVTAGSQKPVITPQFKHLGAKIRLALYETIPGYSVTDVRFYQDASAEIGTDVNPILYQSQEFFPAADATGVVYVAYPSIDSRTAIVSNPSVDVRTSFLSFDGGLDYVSKENREQIDGNVYLGRSSSQASYSVIAIDIPATAGTPLPINMKVDYTLVPTDGAGERIYVHGATASVPAAYTKWASNCMYTYIFKISDQTAGSTGGSVTGLYPISFDAMAVGDLFDDSRETVTTVTGPSITAYQKDMAITTNGKNVYNNDNLYIVVNESNSTPTLAKGTNINLFTVEYSGYESDQITETLVGQCFAAGDSSDDCFGYFDGSNNAIFMTRANQLLTDRLTYIPAQDSPTGIAITVNCASFVPETNTMYAIQYVNQDGDCTYKIINLGGKSIYSFIHYTAYHENRYPWLSFINSLNENINDYGAYFKDCNGTVLELDRQKSEISTRKIDDYTIEGRLCFNGDVAEIFGAFSCINLVSIDLPESLTTIADSDTDGEEDSDGAFAWTDYLSSISIPKNVSRIGNNAFNASLMLHDITLNEGVETIGKKAFCDCPMIGDLIFPSSMLEIEDYAFTSIEETTCISNLVLNQGLTTIGEYSFGSEESNTEIGTLVLNGIPSNISTTAFKNAQIGKVVLNSLDITNINDFNFDDSSIDTLTFCEGHNTIVEEAFYECNAFEHVILPNSMETLESYCFQDCYALTHINIPDGVTNLGEECFAGCYALTDIDIPGGVERIGDYAFSECSSLTTVIFNEGTQTIGECAFEYCENLDSVILPNSMRTLEDGCFNGCTGLTSIVLNQGLESIGAYTFLNCDNLETMICLSTDPADISDDTFGDSMPENLFIYVPDASYDDYVTVWAEAVDTDRIVSFSNAAVPDNVKELIHRYLKQ